MKEYKYSKINRLKEPNTYMYTEYNGDEFIDIYYQNRQSLIDFYKSDEYKNIKNNLNMNNIQIMNKLEFQINNFISKFHISHTKLNYSEENKNSLLTQIPNEQELFREGFNFDIHEVLNFIINDFDNSSSEDNRRLFLNKLLRKFEVRKKIYSSYDQDFREQFGRFDDLEIYLKLKIALIIYYVNNLDVKYLNTILKISDTLCSQTKSSLKNLPHNLHLMVIQSELILISQIQNT